MKSSMSKEYLTKKYCLAKKYCLTLNLLVFIILMYITLTLNALAHNSYKAINIICPGSSIWELCLVTVIISFVILVVCLCVNYKKNVRRVCYISIASLMVINMILIAIEIHQPCNYLSLSSNLIFNITAYWFYIMCFITLSLFVGSSVYVLYCTMIECSYINEKINDNTPIYYCPLEEYSVISEI